jgi:hypothetical protein
MDQKTNHSLIIGILIVLVIVLGVWGYMESRDELDNTLVRMEAEVREHQQKLAVACRSSNTSASAKEDCDKALADFADALEKYQSQLEDTEQELENEQQ